MCTRKAVPNNITLQGNMLKYRGYLWCDKPLRLITRCMISSKQNVNIIENVTDPIYIVPGH